MRYNEHVFEHYGNYYDLFYKNKDYIRETEYIISQLQSVNINGKNLIELGSGTGNYSLLFCNAGYHVFGIEKSQSMITQSRLKEIKNFNPILADMTSFGINQQFDAAYALFDVICYLTDKSDLSACFKNVAMHLKPGGVFIFDSWFTPAVYTYIPLTNIKRVENSEYDITRLSEPEINYQQNTVNINYEIIIRDKGTNQQRTLKEVHTLRHFSIPEIEFLAESTGFILNKCEEIITAKPAGKDTWKVCFQLQKK